MIRQIENIFVIIIIITACSCSSIIPSHLFHEDADKIICVSSSATQLEQFASREIQRYLYLRSGDVLDIVESETSIPSGTACFVVAQKNAPCLGSLYLDKKTRGTISNLKTQEYLLKTIQGDGQRHIIVIGGDEQGVLYGAYRLLEYFGIRFYLDGDVIPDVKISLQLPDIDEYGKPLFSLRGIQPFHDFAEGPDWWNEDDYKAVIAQLPKLRMNFIGLHTYPENMPHAEPTVWIGLPEDIEDDGQVRFSYPATYMNTIRADAISSNWGYESRKTGEFLFGSSALFEYDAYGPEVMNNHFPAPETLDDCNDVFNRTGVMFRNAFEFAHLLGVKTCVGTETALTIPMKVKEHISALGKNPDAPVMLKDVYKGIFTRIMKMYPIDYYWFWTNEGWTWQSVSKETCDAAINDMLIAYQAADEINTPFRFATCGWVLGPQFDRSLFDTVLPKDMALSCINRHVGFTPVEKGFASIKGRDTWAIPWLEDDAALTAPQLWVARMRRDAGDALNYGCNGLMGIHWRTGVIGPNIAALASAAWIQQPWKDLWEKKRFVEHTTGPLSGKHADYPNNPIEGTEDDPLYQNVRWDVSGYWFKAPNGTYTVTLKFCDPHYDKPGVRVFNTLIQGEKVIENLDIVGRVGKNAALDFVFDTVKVSDGWIKIIFEQVIEYPCIAAIIIEGEEYIEKINCGGPAYKDFTADWPPDNVTEIMPHTADFYDDWALHQFGPDAASEISTLFQKMDNVLPRPLNWIDGPGGIAPQSRAWEYVAKEYTFIDEMEALRPIIKGSGNLDRFDYWLHQFKVLKSAAVLQCTWGEFNKTLEPFRSEHSGEIDIDTRIVREIALPLYIQMITHMKELETHLLEIVSNKGEMGTIANIECHSIPRVLERPGQILEELLGEPLPPEARPSKQYEGSPRIFVPTRRSAIESGEDINLEIIVLSKEKPARVDVHWRPIGYGEFQTLEAEWICRGVYRSAIPARCLMKNAIEYYVTAVTSNDIICWPLTAPAICQTVVKI